MKAVVEWRPSKFQLKDGRLMPSDDPKEISIGSRLVGECMAFQYQKALETYAKGRLLDLGCGKVPLFEVYRGLVDEVVCVDWEASLHGSKHVDFFRDLNQNLELDQQSFDTIILSDVLELRTYNGNSATMRFRGDTAPSLFPLTRDKQNTGLAVDRLHVVGPGL